MDEGTASVVDRVPSWFREPTLWQRFAGALIDGLLVGAVSGLLFLVAVVTSSDPSFDAWGITVALTVLRFAYTVGLTVRTGQTIGKQAMRTKAVAIGDGALLSFGPAATRWVVGDGLHLLITLIAPAVGLDLLAMLVVFGPILSGPLHRGLHDRAAGSVVTAV